MALIPRCLLAFAALAAAGGLVGAQAAESPSSTLDWDSAVRTAGAARLMVPGAKLLAVMPTGSMEPVFNERAILLVEPAPFADLKIGDIVTYRNPRLGHVVVHRILEKHGDRYWSKGDNNGHMDRVYITRENYDGRVFGIIYAREPSLLAKNFASGVAAKN